MFQRLSRWAALFCVAVLASAAASRCPAAEKVSAQQKIEAALESSTELEFIETPLQDVIDFLKKQHKIEIQIDRKGLDDVGLDASTIPITKRLKGLSLRSALKLTLDDLDLTYLVEDEVLLITTPEEAETRLTTKFYPVADLIASGNAQESQHRLAEMIHAVTTTVAPWRWESVGGPGSIATTSFDGVPILVVGQTYHVHRKIAAFLEEQRRVLQAAVPRCLVLDVEMTPAVARIEKALLQPTEFHFVEETLLAVAKFLKEKHGIEIQIDRKSLDDVGLDPANILITKDGKGISLRSALRLVLRELDLTYVIQDDVLLITTPEEAETRLTTKIYAVGDLSGSSGFLSKTRPQGMGMGGMGMGGMGMGGMGGGMFNVREEPAEEEEPSPPAKCVKHPPAETLPGAATVVPGGQALIGMITATVAPTSWDEVGGPGSIVGASFRGVDVLVVSQTQEVHEQIGRLLEKLREFVRCNQSPAAKKPAVEQAEDPFGR